MKPRMTAFVVAAALLGAAGLALVRRDDTSASKVTTLPAPVVESTPAMPDLPPNHPPIGMGASPHGTMGAQGMSGMPVPSSDEAPAITWKAPESWKTAANPNAMRIATYHPSADTEVSVARAGGSTEANIERWIGQFDDLGRDARSDETVRGLTIKLVDVTGTYTGGAMMPGASSERHKGWSLVGAVVETPGSHYFFKLLGPTDQVRAARPSLDALLASITPR